MKRTEFLKHACAYGVCGCVGLSFLTDGLLSAAPSKTAVDGEPDWRIGFMQSRFHDLITILEKDVDKETLVGILHQLGAKCGEGFAGQFKDNPEGFFDFIKKQWAESVEYDKEMGIITVRENKRSDCNCPMVHKRDAPDILCNCSLGTQTKIYESLFQRRVDVTLNSSVLRGGERCSFTIKLQ